MSVVKQEQGDGFGDINPSPIGACNTSRQATLWETIPNGYDICARLHRNNPNSMLANARALSSAAKAKQMILAALRDIGEASCETLEQLTGLPHTTCSARISDLLYRDHKVIKSGTGKTRSGCSCSLYKIV